MQRSIARICAALAVAPIVAAASAADWKPAAGPLATRWTASVGPNQAWPEYPRPHMVRDRWLNLNGLWQFAVAAANEQPPLGRALDEQILVPFPVESALSGQMRAAERVWYRRTFAVPEGWHGQRLLLHFGAVDWEATVWVNGRRVGSHRGGYDPFTFDITDAIRPSGEQELIVGVFDPSDAGPQPRGKQVRKPHGIWYTSTTGIWQTVWLEPVPRASIARLQLAPDLAAGTLRATVIGAGTGPRHRVNLTIYERWTPVATQSAAVGETVTVAIPNAKAWSPSEPFLYNLTVSLAEGEREVDAVRGYFGLRSIAVGRDEQGITRLLLNGKFLFQFGPLDQGFWPDGLYTAPSDAALRYDLELTKRLGFNLVRKHVKVEPARWYYWCDKLGLLVWQDMPSGDASVASGKGEITRTPESAAQFETELRGMIEALSPHPSIVMWVVFNEGWGQFDTNRLSQWVRELDPTRLVCGASGWNDTGSGDVHDIHVYPGPRSPAPEPARAAVLGEFGGLGLPLAGHTWQSEKNWGYRNLKTREELEAGYLKLVEALRPLVAEPGLSAAVYTQTTDVEIEVNGLLTYDRAEAKVDPQRIAEANARLTAPPTAQPASGK